MNTGSYTSPGLSVAKKGLLARRASQAAAALAHFLRVALSVVPSRMVTVAATLSIDTT